MAAEIRPHLTGAGWALGRVFRHLGADADPRSILEPSEATSSLAAVAASLLASGHENARFFKVSPSDVLFSDAPALVELTGGEAAVLVESTPHRAVIERRHLGRVELSRSAFAKVATGALIAFPRTREQDGTTVRRTVAVLASLSRPLMVLAAITLGLDLLGLAGPATTRLILDRALPDGAPTILTLLALTVLLVTAHRAVLGVFRDQAVRFIEARLTRDLLTGCFDHLLALPLGAVQRTTLGEMLRVLGSVETMATAAIGAFIEPVLDAGLATLYFAYLWWLFPPAALVAALVSAILFAFVIPLANRHTSLHASELASHAAERDALHELLVGAPTIKAAGVEPRLLSRWVSRLIDRQDVEFRRLQAGAAVELVFQVGAQVAFTLALIGGASRCLDGALTIGGFVATLQLCNSFMGATLRLAQALLPAFNARAHARHADALLATPAARPVCGRFDPMHDPAILVDNVWFRYTPASPWILRGRSLSVPRGAFHRLEGPSGSGKTTILRLVAGLYSPERGGAWVGGIDAPSARAHIMYVPQRAQLYAGTLLENLMLLSSASAGAALAAAERTGMARWVETLPMKYQTRLPAGGGNLSGGQRQLIALTAAVASTRPIVLLDEAMSSLDQATRAELLSTDLFAGRTVVMVEHEHDR